jgi:hypothetical protein
LDKSAPLLLQEKGLGDEVGLTGKTRTRCGDEAEQPDYDPAKIGIFGSYATSQIQSLLVASLFLITHADSKIETDIILL